MPNFRMSKSNSNFPATEPLLNNAASLTTYYQKASAALPSARLIPTIKRNLLTKPRKKALVITQDSDAPTSDVHCTSEPITSRRAEQAGELIKEALPNGGKIMLFVGKSDARNAAERAQGIKKRWKDSKIEIIDTRTDDTDRARAKSNAADTLVKYSDVAALVGCGATTVGDFECR